MTLSMSGYSFLATLFFIPYSAWYGFCILGEVHILENAFIYARFRCGSGVVRKNGSSTLFLRLCAGDQWDLSTSVILSRCNTTYRNIDVVFCLHTAHITKEG